MKKIAVHHVDAFTNQMFGGNPAAVVIDAQDLTDTDMQNIAREMNLSETAFVLPAVNQTANIRVRYFTPTTEVKFCGHATIATLHTLANAKLQGLGAPGVNNMRIETAAGLFEMAVTNTDLGLRMSFTVPTPVLHEYELQGEQFSEAFGIAAVVDPKATIFVEEKPQKFVFVPVVSLSKLREIRYDTERVKQQFGSTKTVIFCFYSNETIHADSNVHARSFGPLIGLDEDPFTGAIQAGLILSAKRNGYIANDQKNSTTEQGHSVGRPGFANITHSDNTVTVTACAVQVFAAEMEF